MQSAHDRNPLRPTAYSDKTRHLFQSKPVTGSNPNPPVIPVQTDRRFRFGITFSD
jgi:hypothetical protein